MAEWLKVIILGIVEGITEFLPISSTGHLIVAGDLLQFNAVPNDLFEIFIQFGAVVAVVLYYAPELWRELRAVPSDKNVQRLWLAVIVASIPAVVVGFLFADKIKAALFNPTVVALAMIIGGVAFLVIERVKKFKASAPSDAMTPPDVSFGQALQIGLWQILALIPGMSRSGMSILGGLASGLDRKAATQFSFYLAIPVLGGATLYEFIKSLPDLNSQSIAYLVVGALISGVVAWFSIRWLLRYVAGHTFIPFGYYRIIVGAVILLLVAVRIL